MNNKKGIFFYLYVSFIFLFGSETFPQSICTNTIYEKGEFNLNTNEICGTQELQAINTSKATNIKYLFDYQGESYEDALLESTNQTKHIFAEIYQPKIYTVVQLGVINGKPSVACKTVTVRSNNVPVYSYDVCSNQVEFVIPVHPSNNFDSYSVVLGAGQSPITILPSDLPYTIKKIMILPQTYSITGIHNSSNKNCTTNIVSKTIPAEVVSRDLPYAPNIEKVELLSLKKVKMDYSGPYSVDPIIKYDLYSYPQGEYSNAKEIFSNIKTGQYIFDVPDTLKSHCFFVRKNQTCGTIKQESAEICTIPIFTVKRNLNNLTNEILWEPYPVTHKGFNVPNLGALSSSTFRSNGYVSIINGIGGTQTMPISLMQNQYIHQPLPCSDVFNYRIQQNIQGTFRFVKFKGVSISNRVKLDPLKIIPPSVKEAWVSTIDNKNKIYFEDNLVEWPIEKEWWYLWKKKGSQFMKVDSSYKRYDFIDLSTQLASETYAISFKDKCGSKSDTSKSINSIYLAYKQDNSFIWTTLSPFSNDNIIQYQFTAIDSLTGQEINKFDFNNDKNEITIDFSSYDDNSIFLIRALGNQHQITSNKVMVPLKYDIYIPTAFSPNDDGINDNLEIKTFYKNIEKFEMKIFNRIGQQVGEINSITDNWNGKLNGTFLPASQYSYYAILKFKNKNEKKITGSFLLLK